MIIRPFNPDDWDAVQSIHDLCKPDEMRGSVALSAIVPLSQDPPILDLFARSSVFVMDEDGNVIGFAAHIGGYISWLCVHPARRRRGVASALLRHLLGRIDRPASLNVGKRNAPARQLYDAFGFQIAEDFIGKFNGHDVEVLKLQLPIGARADDRITLVVEEGPLGDMSVYAQLPIAFEVRSRLTVSPNGRGGWLLEEVPVPTPYVKDYGRYSDDQPTAWVNHFAVGNWRCFTVRDGSRLAGGAVAVADATDVHMLEARSDVALLWDLRVHPDHRRNGIGRALVRAIQAWAAGRGCTMLRVETQDVNVSACRFYAGFGFKLASVRSGAYPTLPDELQLIWQVGLQRPTT